MRQALLTVPEVAERFNTPERFVRRLIAGTTHHGRPPRPVGAYPRVGRARSSSRRELPCRSSSEPMRPGWSPVGGGVMAGRRRRFGSVRKLPSGKYQARYLGPDGQTHTAPTTFRTKTDAEVWLSRIEAQISEGRWLDPFAGKTTVGGVGPPLARCRAAWAQAQDSGVVRVAMAAADRTAPLRPDAGRLGASDHDCRVGRSDERSAQRVACPPGIRLAEQIMDAAVANDLIGMSPCRGVKLPKLPASDPHILTRKQVAEIAANTREPYDLLVWIIAYSGLRVGEAFALRRRHIDLDSGVLKVDSNLMEIGGRKYFDTPKNHQIRKITLPRFLVRELRKHLESNVADDEEAMLFLTYRERCCATTRGG